MILSHSKQFIFIHIYKTAGTTIREPLEKYNIKSLYMWRPYRFASRIMPQILPNPYHRHISAKELKEALGSQVYDDYFKFAFVRNPWDWQVSQYKFALRKWNHHQRKKIRSLGNFENYLKWGIDQKVTLQKSFIYDGNVPLVDYVGKMENIQNDFEFICDQIGIAKVNLGHLNKTNSANYRDFYDDRTKDLVYKTFKEDIKAFKYDF